jgi:hypothetical protein
MAAANPLVEERYRVAAYVAEPRPHAHGVGGGVGAQGWAFSTETNVYPFHHVPTRLTVAGTIFWSTATGRCRAKGHDIDLSQSSYASQPFILVSIVIETLPPGVTTGRLFF